MGLRERIASGAESVRSTFSSRDSNSRKRSFKPVTAQRSRLNPGSTLLQNGDISRKTTKGRLASGFQRREQRPSDISLSDLESAFRQEPLLRRGIQKHASDLTREGFTLTDTTGDTHPENDAFQRWWSSQDGASKLRQLIVSAHVYGDGFLEEAYSDETGTTSPPSDSEVPETATLEAIFVADTTQQTLQQPENESGLFLIEERSFGDDLVLHPDRYEQLTLHRLPGYHHGLSSVEAAYHNAHSKVQADQASGEILFHCGVPFRHYMIEGGDEDEIDQLTALVQSDRVLRGHVSDGTHEIEQQNPQAVDPEPFQEAFLQGIAAAVGMPKSILVGAQAGAVTGSETNRLDYHEDLRSIQENVLTDVILNLAAARLGVPREELGVAWHDFPISPQQKAETARDQARALMDLVNAGVPLLIAAEEVGLDLDEDLVREAVENGVQRTGPLPPGGGA